MGSGSLLSFHLPRFIKESKIDQIRSILNWSYKRCIRLTLILVPIAYLVIYIHHSFSNQSLNSYHLLVYCIWLAPFYLYTSLMNSKLLAYNNPLIDTILYKYIRPLLFIIFFLILVHFNISITVLNTALVYICSTLFLSITYYISGLLLKLPKIITILSHKNKSLDQHNTWKKQSIAYTATNLLKVIASLIPIYLIEIFDPIEKNLSIYSCIFVISSLLNLYANAKSQILSPLISSATKTKESQQKFTTKIKSFVKISFIIQIPISILLILFAKEILIHFNPNYVSGYTVLIVVVIGNCILQFSNASSILGKLNPKLKTKIQIITMISLILFGIPATIKFQLLGIVICLLITKIFAQIYYKYILIKTYHFKSWFI